MKKILTTILSLWTISLLAQEQDTSSLTVSGYADSYYSWYSNSNTASYQQHDCIGAIHNNIGLNVGQLGAAYSSNRVRGTLTVHFGDIPAIAWEGTYRNVQEANGGIRLAKGLWLDAGFFKTHVGTESFLPKDNHLSIITLGTFYGPFYQSGFRLTYETESKWHFEGHVINGYNKHIDDNEFKTFGLLVSKEFSDKLFMSYSNMVGQENTGQLDDGYLVYQNLYANLDFESVEVQLGVDVAMADNWKPGLRAQGWIGPLIAGLATVKYHVSDKWSISARGEIFDDRGSINSLRLTPIITANDVAFYNTSFGPDVGLNILGGTLGIEHAPSEYGFLRIESRYLHDLGALVSSYPRGYAPAFNPMLEDRIQLIATVGFYFDKKFKFAK